MTKTLPRCFSLTFSLTGALSAAALGALLLAAPPSVHAQMGHGPGPMGHPGVPMGHGPGAPMFRVGMAPPMPRAEVRPVQPSPNHVWQSGAWRWNQGQHVWAPGRWEVGRPGHIWVDSHWVQDNGQWAFYDGRWAASPNGYQDEVYAPTPPPAPQYEVVPNAYEPGQEWIGGHWEWHGQSHLWIPGRYEVRPERSYFEHHRWERGVDNRWRFNRGRWHQYP